MCDNQPHRRSIHSASPQRKTRRKKIDKNSRAEIKITAPLISSCGTWYTLKARVYQVQPLNQVQPRTLENLKESIREVAAISAIAIAWLEWYPECRCYLLLRCCETCCVVSFSLPTVCCSSLFVPTLRTCFLLLQFATFVDIEPCFCRFFSPFSLRRS